MSCNTVLNQEFVQEKEKKNTLIFKGKTGKFRAQQKGEHAFGRVRDFKDILLNMGSWCYGLEM